jgi:hypothetical protein
MPRRLSACLPRHMAAWQTTLHLADALSTHRKVSNQGLAHPTGS